MTYVSLSEWEQRVGTNNYRFYLNIGKTLYLARANGLSVYDFDSKSMLHYTSMNSDLPGNFINGLLLLKDSTILVSTDNGLAVIENGKITVDKPVCSTYPDMDARYLYFDSTGGICTFSSHNVYRFRNGSWRSFDLTKKVSYAFEIVKLFVARDNIWAFFEDNTLTSTKFYNNTVQDDKLKLAVLGDTGVTKTFQSKTEFPFRQGPVYLAQLEDGIILKNGDGCYFYNDTSWVKTSILYSDSTLRIGVFQEFKYDRKGNMWYVLENSSTNTYFPVSFNLKTKKITEYLKDTYLVGSVTVLSNGDIVANSQYAYYFKNDTCWVKKLVQEDYGIYYQIYLLEPMLLNGRIYSRVYGSKGDLKDGTFFCFDNPDSSIVFTSNFPFTSVAHFGINKQGKGAFAGKYQTEYFQLETDSAWIKPNMVSNVQKILPCGNGKVYFNNLRYVSTSTQSPFLGSWDSDSVTTVNMGFEDKTETTINDFDIYDNYIAAVGDYFYFAEDSLNSYVSLYNTTNGYLIKFDKTNSCLPDFYYYRDGLFYQPMDTIPSSIAIDKHLNLWVGTNYSLVKVSNTGCRIYNTPFETDTFHISLRKLSYDSLTDELLSCNVYDSYSSNGKMFYIFDINNEKWDSIKTSDMGFKGNFVNFKKLLDNRVWASDDLGYLYTYSGKGKFEVFNLKINGKPNLGSAINDFSIDVNHYLHLGTDFGLLTNKQIITEVKPVNDKPEVINIIPNPATQFISFRNNNYRNIEIYTIEGIMVYQQSTSMNDDYDFIKINVSRMVTGLYFLKVDNKVFKFIKI